MDSRKLEDGHWLHQEFLPDEEAKIGDEGHLRQTSSLSVEFIRLDRLALLKTIEPRQVGCINF
jgi:hypothetical protein